MHYTSSKNIPGLLVLIDFEKAFDSISWSFIYKVLTYFGYGMNIVNWVKILNTNFKASVLQSGFISEQFTVQRGCRQGDPVSPYLFILCAEILAVLVKHNKNIRGIIVQNKEHKLSQYADDTSLTLDGSQESLFAALDTIEYFSKFSGLKINALKTKIVWIGSKRFSKEVFHHSRWKLDWGATSFNLLGIHFTTDLEDIVDINYNLQLPKIKALIKQWKRRILTPIGRITVVKTFIIPKLNHLFISLPTPTKNVISSLNKDIFEFIWKSRSDKIKRLLVTQDYLSGGLKMINIDHFITALKSSWIKRLTQKQKPWMDLFFAINGNDVVDRLFHFGDCFIPQCLLQKNNTFWQNVLNSWLEVMKGLKLSRNIKKQFLNIPVWYNSDITVNNHYILLDYGIRKVLE